MASPDNDVYRESTPVWVELLAWHSIKRWPNLRAESLFRIEANITDEPWLLLDSGRVQR